MLSPRSLQIIERYWQGHLGYPGALFVEPARVLPHGGELEGYHGVFALFREGRVVISAPPDVRNETQPWPAVRQKSQKWLFHGDCTPDSLAQALGPLATAVIGPAFIGYAESVGAPAHPVRSLGPGDAAALADLQTACDAIEWEHGGSAIKHPCSGVFAEGRLVAVAGYKVWGDAIAHLSIVTHPGYRGQGFGRSAIAHLAQRALDAGLLPQYRTLESNRASIRIAENLGFHAFATSMALRFES